MPYSEYTAISTTFMRKEIVFKTHFKLDVGLIDSLFLKLSLDAFFLEIHSRNIQCSEVVVFCNKLGSYITSE